jgi:hypothetical protein
MLARHDGFERFGYTAGLSAVAETPEGSERGVWLDSPQYCRDIQYHSSSRDISHAKTLRNHTDAIQRALTRESIEKSVFLTQTGAEPDLRWCRLLTCYAT